jgi:hypothetical protein
MGLVYRSCESVVLVILHSGLGAIATVGRDAGSSVCWKGIIIKERLLPADCAVRCSPYSAVKREASFVPRTDFLLVERETQRLNLFHPCAKFASPRNVSHESSMIGETFLFREQSEGRSIHRLT